MVCHSMSHVARAHHARLPLSLSLAPPHLCLPSTFLRLVFPLASPPPHLYISFNFLAIESILSISLSLSLRVWVVCLFLGYREINDSPSRVEGFI